MYTYQVCVKHVHMQVSLCKYNASVLHSVLQCIAVCYSVLHSATHYNTLQHTAEGRCVQVSLCIYTHLTMSVSIVHMQCCSVLQYAFVREWAGVCVCMTLHTVQCIAVCNCVLQYVCVCVQVCVCVRV